MDLGVLRGFASRARVDLLKEVGARLDVVLASGSQARVESPGAVGALERLVSVEGRGAVVDRVAYVWFNRVVALRFMDVHGFTGVGVVSAERGAVSGQPQVLSDAKGGIFDVAVVPAGTREVVTGLLNGSRLSQDPQGEAYGLLLEAYCRFWNAAMPFMFEREGDVTELLMPTSLLASDSVRDRAVRVLTDEVCRDVEVIGWLYQFYIADRKDEVFAGFKKGKKAGAAEIPAATQLFTPHWIVRYLVENSLGRLWMLNHPDSRLVDQMDYYIAPVDEEADFLRVSSPEELTVMDPACGSGHMLTYAFDLLYSIYEEQGYAPSEIPSLILNRNLFGTEIDPRAGSLAAFALTMKAAARRKTFLKTPVHPNICVIKPVCFTTDELSYVVTRDGNKQDEESFWNQFDQADILGSLIQPDPTQLTSLRMHLDHATRADDLLTQDIYQRAETVLTQAHFLATPYTIVITNPPYMGSKNVGGEMSLFLKDAYQGFQSDVFAAFILRSWRLVRPGGALALMTPNVWLYILSHSSTRELLVGDPPALRSLVELPLSGFKTATVQVCAFVAFKTNHRTRMHFSRLVEERGNETTLATSLREDVKMRRTGGRVSVVSSADLAHLPGGILGYWLGPEMLEAFKLGEPMSKVTISGQGLATADNARFLRMWFEVAVDRIGFDLDPDQARASSFKWFPHNKGGDFRKWFGNQEWVVNWEDDGAEVRTHGAEQGGRPKSRAQNTHLYFKPSLSCSMIGTGNPAFRFFPQGFIFDVAGTSVFADSDRLLELAALTNSSVARSMLEAMSPTLNLGVGTLAQLPVIDLGQGVQEIVAELVDIHRSDWNSRETSWGFETLDLLNSRPGRLIHAVGAVYVSGVSQAERVAKLETTLNQLVADAYGLAGVVDVESELREVTLWKNPLRGRELSSPPSEPPDEFLGQQSSDLLSYAVGCMFGRYSIDVPGLILADQASTLDEFRVKIPETSFMPDRDNVLPIVDGDWFEDDIVARFREFLRAAFGTEHFEENLAFVVESLGVRSLRDYFVKSFYKDHVQRYKKRPIYWLFSSPQGSFTALVYLHRYTASTASTVLNEYLREYIKKLEVAQAQAERTAVNGTNARETATAQREAERLRKVLVELNEYERDLYAVASQQIDLDLDDGVLVNYQKLGSVLKDIGLKKAKQDD